MNLKSQNLFIIVTEGSIYLKNRILVDQVICKSQSFKIFLVYPMVDIHLTKKKIMSPMIEDLKRSPTVAFAVDKYLYYYSLRPLI